MASIKQLDEKAPPALDDGPAASRPEPEQETASRPGAPPRQSSNALAHWVLLILSLVVFALALVLSVRGEEQVIVPVAGKPLPGLCGSKMIFGIECPGCGLTRCFINLAHSVSNTTAAAIDAARGRFPEASKRIDGARHNIARAWHYNPGGFLLFALMLAQIPLRSWMLWRTYRGKSDRLFAKSGYWALCIVAAALVGQWLVKMGLRVMG